MIDVEIYQRIRDIYDNFDTVGITAYMREKGFHDTLAARRLLAPMKSDMAMDTMNGLYELFGNSLCGQILLDMGSHRGLACLGFNACMGLETYGIEWIEPFVDSANEIEHEVRKKDLLRADCHYFWGNFFPPDFETDLRFGACDDSKDVYLKMGIPLSSFDFLHAYQYVYNTPAILRLVAERCSPGTIFIETCGDKIGDRSNVPGNMELLKITRGGTNIFQVT